MPGRLGLIAGGGDLPLQIARHCVETGRPLFVVRLRGFADPSMDAFPGEVVGLAEVGRVVCDGLVLAVEAQEGTDAMLRRVAEEVAPALRGEAGRRRGVLAKAPKPIQETRVDLPTIGPATVRGAARAGLAGLVGEAGRTLVLDREDLVALADELGLFVLGVEAP